MSDAHLLHNLGVDGENLSPDPAPDLADRLGPQNVLPSEGVEASGQRVILADGLGDFNLGLHGVENPLRGGNSLSGR